MKTIFDETILGGIKVKNRLVRSATFEYAGDEEGRVTGQLGDLYEALAKGGVGTIITGMVGVDENSRIAPQMIKTYEPTFEEKLSAVVDLVHSHDCRVVVQLAHCGAKVAKTDAGGPPLGASARPGQPVREMDAGDIRRLIDSFAQAAARCKNTGADGIQLHAAHGYLISQFLSPIFNSRTDAYGGNIENRARLLFQIYTAVRAAVGKDYPVWCKLNSSDIAQAGMSLEESTWVCKQLSELGVDAVEVSGGVSISRESAPARMVSNATQEAYFSQEAQAIADEIAIDVISVGGYRTPDVLEKKLNAGNIKAISLCRPLISEPALAAQWLAGSLAKARCISCNRCFAPGDLSCKAFPQ